MPQPFSLSGLQLILGVHKSRVSGEGRQIPAVPVEIMASRDRDQQPVTISKGVMANKITAIVIILTEKIPEDKILISNKNLLHMSEEATFHTAYGYSM